VPVQRIGRLIRLRDSSDNAVDVLIRQRVEQRTIEQFPDAAPHRLGMAGDTSFHGRVVGFLGSKTAGACVSQELPRGLAGHQHAMSPAA